MNVRAPRARPAAVLALPILAAVLLRGAGCGGDSSGEGRIDRSRLPVPPAEPPDRVAVSHILVAYRGAVLADSAITRTREEARERAAAISRLARLEGADFGALAREHSDDPSAEGGGYLDVLPRGEMVEPFEEAAFGMGVGQVSDPVETPFGFHVIRREPIAEVAASHILVTWKGARATGAPLPESAATRTREEARARAEEVRRQAVLPGADFAALAREFSDCPTAANGGDLGRFGRGGVVEPIEDAAFGLEVGEVSGIVESEFGFHLVKRSQ